MVETIVPIKGMLLKWTWPSKRKLKHPLIKATVLAFNIEPKFSNRLVNVSDIASKSTYDVIDLKIKVISKNEEKQKL